jgi:hypothetical protein
VDGVIALNSLPAVCSIENMAKIEGSSLKGSGASDITDESDEVSTSINTLACSNNSGNEGGSNEGGNGDNQGGSGGSSSSRSGSRAKVDGDKIDDESGQVAGEQISDEMLPVTGGGQSAAAAALALLVALGCLARFGRVALDATGKS